MEFQVVLVTAPDLTEATKLAHSAIEAELIACANIVPSITSIYRWEGKVQQDSECMIIFKTTKASLTDLEELILREHPYDTPEFVALTPTTVAERYGTWMLDSIKPRTRK